MIKSIQEKPNVHLLELDLTGPSGNAFALCGHARMLAKNLGLDPNPIVKDMTSSDYEHLLKVFEQHFGDYVILYR
jgi:hypothetical protein